jgi:hypothetical protein
MGAGDTVYTKRLDPARQSYSRADNQAQGKCPLCLFFDNYRHIGGEVEPAVDWHGQVRGLGAQAPCLDGGPYWHSIGGVNRLVFF